MKLVPIFVAENLEEAQGLWAIRYDDECDEYERLFDCWTDPEYLTEFYNIHIDDLYCSPFNYNKSVSDAVLETIEEAHELEETILRLAEFGFRNEDSNLQHLFKPLVNHVYELSVLQKSKASVKTKWRPHPKLRIYAIRLAPNLYIVTGGAIKLTRGMEERPHTREELNKIERVRRWLQQKGITEPEDLNYEEPL